MKKLKHIIVLLVLFSTSCQKEKIENPNNNFNFTSQNLVLEFYVDSIVHNNVTTVFNNNDSLNTHIIYIYKQIIGVYVCGNCIIGSNFYKIEGNSIIMNNDSSIIYFRKYRQNDYIKNVSCF